jgi:hypothetical protein
MCANEKAELLPGLQRALLIEITNLTAQPLNLARD